MEHVFDAQLRTLEQISLGQQQQTAVLGRIGLEQIEQLRSINNTMDALLSEMEAIHNTQAQGLALQQAMLAREVFQDKMEEFVYQAQKMIAEFQKPKSDYPPPTQYYLLDGMFKQIDAAGISTAVIKGRENKASFDECVTKGKTLYRQLTKHPDVQQAIAWAESERKKRLALEQKKSGEEQRRREEIQGIRRQIEKLEASRKKLGILDWLNHRFGNLPEVVRYLLLVPPPGVFIFIFYKITVASDEAALNDSIDRQIEKLQAKLTALQTSR
jgi:hypothetical protein